MQVGVGSRLYNIWKGIKQRVSNPKASGFEYYGGRGITYTPEWEKYSSFKSWALSSGYRDDLTIERREADGDYTPENCYWADLFIQASNKRKRTRAKHTYIGVRKLPSGNWQAIINIQKSKLISIGVFPSEIDAAIKRDEYIKTNQLPHKLNF